MAGPSDSHPQQRASGSSTGSSADPGLAVAPVPSHGRHVAHAMDVSAEDWAVWDQFQMFKLLLERGKRSNVSMGATKGALPPRGRANPSQTVQARAPDPVLYDVTWDPMGKPVEMANLPRR